MISFRIVGAAAAVVAVGATALLPSIAYASSTSATTTGWADRASSFTPAQKTLSPGGWTFSAQNGAQSIANVATFGADGITATSSMCILRSVTTPIAPAALPDVIATSLLDAGQDAQFGVLLSGTSNPETPTGTAVASSSSPGGLDGASTMWTTSSGSTTTSALADQLTQGNEVVSAYFICVEPSASGSANTGSQADANAANSIGSVSFDNMTTYFTPKPTATVVLTPTSVSMKQATTSGVHFIATGFAPNEPVHVSVVPPNTQTSVALDTGTLTADADGSVSATVVLPVNSVNVPGAYPITLTGDSSGQVASSRLVISADQAPVPPTSTPSGTPTSSPVALSAPVAIAVTAKATFTG